MRQRLSNSWKRVPDRIRRPVVLIVGVLIVLLSGAIGWLPGPGGIPLFLLGIAILASEFHWAHRIKVFILDLVYASARWLKANRTLAALVIIAGVLGVIFITYTLLYRI